nr:hypothetical protein [Tanacetum cinerariifolium]
MSTLKFVDTHKMVTFLEKPTESKGFEQIVYFLSAHTLRVDGKEIIITESSVRRDLRLADEDCVDYLPNSTIFEILNCWDEAVYKELDKRLVRATTTASSLKAKQDSGNIDKTQSKATPNEASSLGTNLDEQNLSEDASKQGRIEAIDANEDITLVNDQDDAEMFDVTDLHNEDVFVEKELADKEVNDEVQKVVEEVVEDINTAKLIV